VKNDIKAAKGMVACITYGAKSTEDEHGSVPSQIKAVRAATEGGREIVGTFSDEAASAYSGSRGPGLAAAIDAAGRAAEGGRPVELWAFDADRLARGDGKRARHLGGLWFDLRAVGVEIRAVEGDDDLRDAIRVVLRGERNHQDSAAKSGHVRRGIDAQVRRGEWRGGSLPDGYAVLKGYDDRDRPTRTYVKDPERAPLIELIWRMALQGRSLRAIELEIDRQGWLTEPKRAGTKPQPIDSTRIAQMLRCGVYAGLQLHHGELIPIEGWPRYVEPEDFHRREAARKARGHKRKGGPRPAAYLLAELATCGSCGATLRVETQRRPRKDGTRRRTYLCSRHRQHHADSEAWCASPPYDAERIDLMVAEGLAEMLRDADAMRQQLLTAHAGERERLERVVQEASEAVRAAKAGIERADRQYADALAKGDDAVIATITAATALLRKDAEQAQARATAALDALSEAEAEHTDEGAEALLGRLWAALGGQLQDARGDVERLNVTLREFFERFVVHREPAGGLRVVPVLSAEGIGRLIQSEIGAGAEVRVAVVEGGIYAEGLTDTEAARILAALNAATAHCTETGQAGRRRPARDRGPGPPCARLRARGWR
jgi:DNA invertase Pin-like site-specific DNA recombinase